MWVSTTDLISLTVARLSGSTVSMRLQISTTCLFMWLGTWKMPAATTQYHTLNTANDSLKHCMTIATNSRLPIPQCIVLFMHQSRREKLNSMVPMRYNTRHACVWQMIQRNKYILWNLHLIFRNKVGTCSSSKGSCKKHERTQSNISIIEVNQQFRCRHQHLYV